MVDLRPHHLAVVPRMRLVADLRIHLMVCRRNLMVVYRLNHPVAALLIHLAAAP